MRVVQVNVSAACGSHGVIAEEIGRLALGNGWESKIAYGRRARESRSELIRVGGKFDMIWHGIESRLFDRHGLASLGATRRLVKQLEEYKPDIVHLHNIHGYYLNYPSLFDYLKLSGVRVIWTLHDCWPFTGHCAYYTAANCMKWQSHCVECPEKGSYPASLAMDRSTKNFNLKRRCFTGLKDLTLVPVSDWLAGDVRKSFLGEYPIMTIHNGVDLDIFKPRNNKGGKFILGVASIWERRKGLPEFFKLREILPQEYKIFLVGLSEKQLSMLPDGIEGIMRTDSCEALSELYSRASVLINPTYEDNFPTVNIEALACGTPVVTYRTGGSPEAVDELTGVVVERGDVQGLVEGIRLAERLRPEDCRARAEAKFNKDDCFRKYIELYEN